MKTKGFFNVLLLILNFSIVGLLFYYVLLLIFEESFWEDLKDWPQWIIVDYVWCLAIATVMVHYFLWKRRDEILKIEKTKMQTLKDQLSPHFVFNNFSILADLIEVDPEKASSFLMNLSKVYQYMLSHIEHNTVTLQEEIEYIQYYLTNLKTRFNDNIQVIIAPDIVEQKGKVPPAVLQLLIENAIKHNEHTTSNPLIIEVTTDGLSVTVRNKKHPIITSDSTNIGHRNIVKRYKLLTSKKVRISNSTDEYSITIPLITK